MYKYRRETIVIGLTGRTGSGCTTVAEILKKSRFSELDLRAPKTYDFKDMEERKHEIIYKYMQEDDNWKGFYVVEGSAVILSFILEKESNDLFEYLDLLNKNRICIIPQLDTIKGELKTILGWFGEYKNYNTEVERIDKSDLRKYYVFYNEQLTEYKNVLRELLGRFFCYPDPEKKDKAQLYTFLMQTWGNNIRMSGDPYCDSFSQNHYYSIAQRMDSFITVYSRYLKECEDNSVLRVAIDAIRNPYEAIYFNDNYAQFFLFSISTEEQYRRMRLSFLNKSEQDMLEKTECPEKFKDPSEQFYHQNIQACLEISDIHIYNPDISDRKFYFLTSQIVKYIALILHPGLITPSSIERCMQLAYNAKFNSGCLSRQVGAVVSGDDYSVRAVGWNDVPKGQIPCNLRSVEEYCKNKDRESYSEFELCDEEFENGIKKIQAAIKNVKNEDGFSPYCFKDVYCGYKGEKNQVFTRSLHAEENAFLQISKYGGSGIKGGFLFTTASPCELCAKKAYQLGIRKIYYIDRYPGISAKHILSFGKSDNPLMCLFYGAIGNAYISLYEPRMAHKDELELKTGISVKQLLERKDDSEKNIISDIKYNSVYLKLDYENSDRIISCRDVQIEVIGNPIDQLNKEIIWTGCEYHKSELVDNKEFDLIDNERSVSPYQYTIRFNRYIFRGERVSYKVKTYVSDRTGEMKPFVSHTVKNPTDSLKIEIRLPINKVSSAFFQEYYDSGRELPSGSSIKLDIEETDGYASCCYEVKNPTLLHTYGIYWDN